MAGSNPMVATPTTPGGMSQAEAMYRGVALSQLNILRQHMQLGGLNSGRRSVRLDNGVEIHCNICFNKEDVYVNVPPAISVGADTTNELSLRFVFLWQGPEASNWEYLATDSPYGLYPRHQYLSQQVPDSNYDFTFEMSTITVAKGTTAKALVAKRNFSSPELFPAFSNRIGPTYQYWFDGVSTYVGVPKNSRYIYADIDYYANAYITGNPDFITEKQLLPTLDGYNGKVQLIVGDVVYDKYFGHNGDKEFNIDTAAVAKFVIGGKTVTFLIGSASTLNVYYGNILTRYLINNGTTVNTLFVYELGIDNPDKISNTVIMQSTDGVLLPACTNIVFDTTGKKAFGFCYAYERAAVDSSMDLEAQLIQDYNVNGITLERLGRNSYDVIDVGVVQQYTFVVDFTCALENDVYVLKYTVSLTKYNHDSTVISTPPANRGDTTHVDVFPASLAYSYLEHSYTRIDSFDLVNNVPVYCYKRYKYAITYGDLVYYTHTFEYIDPQTGEPVSTTITYSYCGNRKLIKESTLVFGTLELEILKEESDTTYSGEVWGDWLDRKPYTYTSDIALKNSAPQITDLRMTTPWKFINEVVCTTFRTRVEAEESGSDITSRTLKRTIYSTLGAVCATVSNTYGMSMLGSTLTTTWGGSAYDINVFAVPFERSPMDWFDNNLTIDFVTGVGDSNNYLYFYTRTSNYHSLRHAFSHIAPDTLSYFNLPTKTGMIEFASKMYSDNADACTITNSSDNFKCDSTKFYRAFPYSSINAAYLPQ